MKKPLVGAVLGGLLILSACSNKEASFAYEDVKNPEVDHIHGSGYSNGGPDFVIATHAGLYAYGEDGWKEANREKNDYMGFQPTEDGFFASGHPAVNSDLKNPFGLMKSTDKGATFEQLAFYGEIDFHYLGAGYKSNVVYVFNESPTADLKGGLNYTLDEGKTWTTSKMEGFTATTLSNLAVHPSNEEMIAIGSQEGLFLSTDFGDTFAKLNDATMITYVTLIEDGGYYATIEKEDRPRLNRFTIDKTEESTISLPDELHSPIQFIATSPDDSEEVVVTAYDNSIYKTTDAGSTWIQLANAGQLKTSK
ncbi:F510_1955 family glycosylhydrolase [Sporosarcina aquimarina]|uniref:Sialidase n=1 Tax=Sporosarcina aquimarina TaxID=114975 RepID=A0ABU4G472_9BACL|nr:sialidase [Sporosarcina aquimarina]MDW0111113.1 sialidase [Sporosarcina aquimarina]